MREPDFHPGAKEEMEGASEYYGKVSQQLAHDFISAVSDALRRADEDPDRFLVVSARGTTQARRVLVERFPYAVIFEPRDDGIWVFAVAHMKRRPGYWRRRMS